MQTLAHSVYLGTYSGEFHIQKGKKLLFKPYLCIMMPLYSHMHCYALLEGHIQTIKLLFLSGGNRATVGFAYSFHISDQRPFLHNFYKQKNPGLKPGVVV